MKRGADEEIRGHETTDKVKIDRDKMIDGRQTIVEEKDKRGQSGWVRGERKRECVCVCASSEVKKTDEGGSGTDGEMGLKYTMDSGGSK